MAELEAIAMDKYIQKERFMLAMVVDHVNIDNIERNIAELVAYSREEQEHDALAKCEMLAASFNQLSRNYNLRVENIF